MFMDNIKGCSLVAYKFIFLYEIVNWDNIVLMKSDGMYLPANTGTTAKSDLRV